MNDASAQKPDRSVEAGAAVIVVGVAAQLFLGTAPDSADTMGALANGCCGGPFYFAGFVLGIVAMARGRIAGGLLLLIAALAAPIVAAGFALAFTST